MEDIMQNTILFGWKLFLYSQYFQKFISLFLPGSRLMHLAHSSDHLFFFPASRVLRKQKTED